MAHSAPLEPEDPRQIGAYRLVSRLGVGGQGVVYLGQVAPGANVPAEVAPGEPVAVKVLRSDWLKDPSALRRLAKEVAAARRVASFCTARVLDADLDARPPYVVGEYIDGPTLLTHVSENGPLRGPRLMRLAVGTATALTAIHQHGVVHRDFKPGNIILGPDGPRVIDFGIAQEQAMDATGTGNLVGTPMYMAPEHFLSTPIGPASDVFAWASTMVYAATGRGPFTAPTIAAVMNRVINDGPTTGDLPEPLAGLVNRCLAKDPAARPTSRDVLLSLLAGTDAAVPPDSAVYAAASHAAQAADPAGQDTMLDVQATQPGGGAKRKKVLAGIAAGLATVAIIVGVAFFVFGRGPGHAVAADSTPSTRATGQTSQPSPRNNVVTGKGKHKGKKGKAGKKGRKRHAHHRHPARPKANKYTATQACGSGYRVLESRALHLKGARVATVYLLYNNRKANNCAVTLRSDRRTGTKSGRTITFLQVKGSAGQRYGGRFKWYAGPARAHAPHTCVRWGGSFTMGSTTSYVSPYEHCG